MLFYILTTTKVISGRVPTMTVHTHGDFHNVAPYGNQAASSITQNPTQFHYPDTVLINPCAILAMLSAMLGSDKYQLDKSLV